MAAAYPFAHLTVVPSNSVSYPWPVPEPPGFDPARQETWPTYDGRYEYVGGRLEFMPPCGEVQQSVAMDIASELNDWRRVTPGFRTGGNEAGMILGGDTRGADAAVWRADTKPVSGFARVPPVLAVEVAGMYDTAEYLEGKAKWYLSHGVECVWIVLPETRCVRVVTKDGRVEVTESGKIPEHPSLPGLSPDVRAFFQQL